MTLLWADRARQKPDPLIASVISKSDGRAIALSTSSTKRRMFMMGLFTVFGSGEPPPFVCLLRAGDRTPDRKRRRGLG